MYEVIYYTPNIDHVEIRDIEQGIFETLKEVEMYINLNGFKVLLIEDCSSKNLTCLRYHLQEKTIVIFK